MIKEFLAFLLSFSVLFQSSLPVYAQTFDHDPKPRVYGNIEPSYGTVTVHVLGEVTNPGTYNLRPNDRLLRAIQSAGGLTQSASQTKIELRRGKEAPRRINLLLLNREGNLSRNPFLQENDVIFVPRKLASAAIHGTVRYPGVYEINLDQTTSVWDVLDMAGGFTVGLAHGQPLTVIRYDESNEKKVLSVNNQEDDLKSFKLIDGDTIFSPHKFTINNKFDNSVEMLPNDQIDYPSYSKNVFILGGVKVPGKFPFAPQHRLSNYVALAGGLAKLGREDCVIIRANGVQIKSNIYTSAPINPGDTVVVGENQLGPDFWVSISLAVVSMGMTAYSIFRSR